MTNEDSRGIIRFRKKLLHQKDLREIQGNGKFFQVHASVDFNLRLCTHDGRPGHQEKSQGAEPLTHGGFEMNRRAEDN